MKKFSLIIAAMLLSCIVSAQSIVLDKVDSDGFRYIQTNMVVCRAFTDRIVFSFGLANISNDTSEAWLLNIDATAASQLSAKENSKLLLKTFQGNVIELSARFDSDDWTGKVRTLHDFGGVIVSTYNITMSYPINEDQLLMLKEEGLAKLRMEASPNNLDKEYKKDQVGTVLGKAHNLIISTKTERKDFYDGF